MQLFFQILSLLAGPLFFGLGVFWLTLVTLSLFPEVGRGAVRVLTAVEQVFAHWLTLLRKKA